MSPNPVQAPSRPAFRVALDASDPGCARVLLFGEPHLLDTDELRSELRARIPAAATSVLLDLSGVEALDGASTALLLTVRGELRERGASCDFHGARPEVAKLLELYGCPLDFTCLKPAPARIGTLDHVGQGAAASLESAKGILGFAGDCAVSLLAAARRPRTVNWADVGKLMERTGADGVPIVLLINFLVGLIIALQSAAQLQRFGANVFVSNLVGLSVVRELAPLMTGIIVAGRSGAAFAAELGSMRVSEEIDALRALRLDPMRQLVFPRVISLALVVPALVLLASLVGCLGGLFVALYSLDLSTETYTNGIQNAVGLSDVLSAQVKSVVFALTIALISCQRGLATTGGATGVGSATTSAVVTILFALVVIDALFTALFHVLGI